MKWRQGSVRRNRGDLTVGGVTSEAKGERKAEGMKTVFDETEKTRNGGEKEME